MIFKEGTANSLLEVLEEFTSFVVQDDNGEKWELIRYNPNSFYGTTFKAKGIDEDSFVYLSIRHQEVILGETYKEWYKNKYMSEDNYHEETIYDKINSITGEVDIFESSGNFLAFNVHKQFDSALMMCEQGGTFNPSKTDLRFLANRLTFHDSAGNYRGEKFFTPSVFPDIGRPLLTVSQQNKEQLLDGLSYYFTRDRNSATITIEMNGYYQSISFGFLDGIDYKTYKFPAYIGGGTSGLKNKGWIYYPRNASHPTHREGNIISLDITSTCLSNGTLLNATMLNSNISNTLLMSPDGQWEYYYNYTQGMQVIPQFICSGVVTNWAFPLTEPIHIKGGSNSVFPAESDFDEITDFEDIFDKKYNITPLMIPVCFCRNKETHFKGMMGFIRNHFAIFSKRVEIGINTFDGKKYLVLPNGWLDRVRYYPPNVGVSFEWENDKLIEKYNKIKNSKFCLLAIKLEE